jgi:hypothetical protein
MGVAAYNRASKVISARVCEDVNEAIEIERLGMTYEVAEECNAFVTAAMAYMGIEAR